MRAFAEEIWKQLGELKLKATFTQVPREQNKEADKLTNMAMDGEFVDDTM
jgi:ribonuclease HI